MNTKVDTLLKSVASEQGLEVVFAQPSEHNVDADGKEVVYLWKDIQEDGTLVVLSSGGYRMQKHLKLNFVDGTMWFEEEGEKANNRKNEMLAIAFAFYKKFTDTATEEGLFYVTQDTTWSVKYNYDDANQLVICLDMYVIEENIEGSCL